MTNESTYRQALNDIAFAFAQYAVRHDEIGYASVKTAIDKARAKCAPREAVCDRIVCWHNRRCVNDDAATMRKCPHRATAPQAECAPREAQPVAWRYFDGEGNYEYREDPPSESSVYHASIYGRKFEPLYLAVPTPERAQLPDLMQTFHDDDMGRRGFVSGWNAAIGEVAKSERAQESAGVALTDEDILNIAVKFDGRCFDYNGFARAILAANKT